MAQATVKVQGYEFTFTDADVANPEEYIPAGEYNPHHVRPFVLACVYGVVCVVFAQHEQDALDAAVDAGKLDGYKVAPEDEDEDTAYLGNASEAFDISDLQLFDVPIPPFSFAALVNAAQALAAA